MSGAGGRGAIEGVPVTSGKEGGEATRGKAPYHLSLPEIMPFMCGIHPPCSQIGMGGDKSPLSSFITKIIAFF
jgi:hypothetical protein